MGAKTQPSALKDKKGVRTRESIVRAARKAFSKQPYHAASMRMIGKEAGIEHPLINYYFPSKAKLFEAVVLDICNEFITSNEGWLESVRTLGISEGFTKYIDQILEFNDRNPEPMRILALNMPQTDSISQIPGYRHLPELIENIRKLFEEKISPAGPVGEIRMFIHSFNFLLISFLGASGTIAQVQGMDPGSRKYRDWVRQTLGYIFLPRLRDIINPPPNRNDAPKKKKRS